ncbi:hypothetical protein POM88_004785 [Heracleum sosnowskyi]|uniref:Replication protein A 70 kDa DNA-binding subunit B/D first OB fold domain-containing protein n=1 Tax=Heracleum sosnowskyi TaxID=360622 RepID=A0AAD8N810_9APIA|nr:hypothetical protein POM88_004785 [Heracleum sosnowskyi]
MSTNRYENISNLKTGRYDYKIKVRVIRFWKVITRTGEELKCFNVMLLDNKKTRIHAFIPTACADQHERKLRVGKVYNITNFTVQQYRAEEKYRCLRNDKQLIFSKDTKIEDTEDKANQIQQDAFDFYDHSELMALTKQTTYLADVVGIIKSNFKGINKLHNRLGKDQCQAKFTITDGKSNIKVTFWDRYAELFAKTMSETVETPLIIIIATCKVGLWNDEVDISNVRATKFYLNYNHHSVLHMRKMLKDEEFSKKIFEKTEWKMAELRKIGDIKNLGKEAIETQVLTHLRIQTVEETEMWYSNYCTTCKNKTHMLVDTEGSGKEFPLLLKELANKDYTMKLRIKELNILHKNEVYCATNICNGFKLEEVDTTYYNDEMSETATQATTSTYHLDGMSDIN